MAINVDKAYRVVLAVLNKEQRGYLTPDQFKRLGRQAQLDLLEKSFHDYSRYVARGVTNQSDQYANLAGQVMEKIDAFAKDDDIAFTAGVGDLPGDCYKIVQLTTQDRSVEVDMVSKSELTYLQASRMIAPSESFPVGYHQTGKIHILPTSIASAKIDYIRMPADPVWGFTGGGASAYTHDPGSSVDFELHPSEEPMLITKILALAGVVIKDPTVIEVAMRKEADNFNTENS